MTIGDVSKQVGIPTKTIRFYEEIQLLKPAKRGENNYRTYYQTDIAVLNLIKEARALGLSINDTRNIVDICQNKGCEHISEYLSENIPSYLQSIDHQISRLQELKSRLKKVEQSIKDKTIACNGPCDACNILCQSSKNC